MNQRFLANVIVNVIANLVSTALLALLAWFVAITTNVVAPTFASFIVKAAQSSLIVIVSVLSGLTFFIVYRRYLEVLRFNERPEGTIERQAYDALRKSLANPTRFYVGLLTRVLDEVDRFFGDARRPNRTLSIHVGLRTPAPLWTAPALERCLLLALIYPIAMIFIVWAMSGHVGPAERALGLSPDVPSTGRILIFLSLYACGFAFWHGLRSKRWVSLLWIVGAVALARAFIGPVFSVIAAAIASLLFLSSVLALNRRWQGPLLACLLPFMIVVCLGAAKFLSPLESWEIVGPLLLFLGLLTLINAPFSWATIGLTRALLRRGLELGGWWPLFLSLLDAAISVLIITSLALVMVIGIQTFNSLTAYGGGRPVLSLAPLLNGIAVDPTAPEYWWVYALLFSTMTPSLINLAIGGTSLMRGVPSLSSLILRSLPVGSAIPRYDRPWIASILTLQAVGGVILGVVTQSLLIAGIIGYLMPRLGVGLFDMVRAVLAFDLPSRIGQFFGAGV
jgi:hypothetical protein